MNIYYDFNTIPNLQNSILTIGTFDGVHRGHQVLLQKVVQISKRLNQEYADQNKQFSSMVMTFDPHPRQILFPEKPFDLIIPIEKRLELLAKNGIENTLVLPFSLEISDLSAEDFLQEILLKKLKMHTLVVGWDFCFGKNKQGDIAYLQTNQNKFGFRLETINKQSFAGKEVSSSLIRNLLKQRKISETKEILGW